eukprot:Colp12_sorted_trinity150504_noHs@6523
MSLPTLLQWTLQHILYRNVENNKHREAHEITCTNSSLRMQKPAPTYLPTQLIYTSALRSAGGGGDGDGGGELGVSKSGAHVVVGLVPLSAQLVEGIHLHDAVHHGGHVVHLLLLLGGERALGLLGGRHHLVSSDRLGQDVVEHSHSVVGVAGDEHALAEQVADATGAGDQVARALGHGVVGALVGLAEGEGDRAHDGADAGDGEVLGVAHQSILVLLEEVLHGELEEGVDALHVLVLLVVPQGSIAQVQGAEGVSEAAGEHLLELESAAQHQREVRADRKVGRESAQLALVVGREVGLGAGAEHRAAQGAADVGEQVAHETSDLLGEALAHVL